MSPRTRAINRRELGEVAHDESHGNDGMCFLEIAFFLPY